MPNPTHILLSLPEANKTESYEALGGKIFEFQFDINETEIKQDQYNMIISGEEIGKGNIELKGLYTPNADDLPHFILQNSSDVLSTGDFLAICQPDLPTVYADPVPLGDPQPHDAISFKMPENVGEEVEVPLQQDYTVLTTGWADDPQSSSKVLEVTREVLNDQGKYEDVVVGKFLYNEQNGLRFVLEEAVPHESNNEFVLNAKIWLLDPEGNPVWPDVQITVEADLPNFAGNFELFDGSDIGAYTGVFTGTWPCPSQQEIMDGLQLTFGFELPGYDMQFDIPIDLANATTVQLDGRDFFTIKFNTNNTFSIEFLSSYDPTAANPFPPFTGPLTIKVTATDDEGNSSSLRTDINLTFTEAGISFPPATPGGGRVAEPYLKPDAPFVDESDIGTASAVVDVPVPDGWMLITSDNQLKSPPVNGKFDLEKDWTAEADGTFTLATDHGYLTLTNNPDGTVQKLTYTLTDGADHSDTPFPIKDPASSDYLETIMEGVKIVLFANPDNQGADPALGLPTYPYPIQTTVVVPIKDGEPEITVDPMPGALEAGVGGNVSFDANFGPDGQADDRPYAFTVANHTTGEDATVYLTLGGSQSVTFTNTDPDTGVVSSYQVYVELDGAGSLIFRPGAGQTQNMTYGVTVTITDSDGDKAAASTPTFTVNGFEHEIRIGDDGVFEAYLPNGSEADPNAAELTAETTVEGGWKLDTSVAVEGVNWVVDANDPLVMVLDLSNTADGGIYTYNTNTSELTFTLTSPIGHPFAGGNNTDYINRDFSFFHPAAPGAGLVTKTAKVLVTDDVPAVNLGAPQGTDHFASEPITGDVSKFMFGADGPANQNPIEVTIVVTDDKAVPPTTYTAKAYLQVGAAAPVMDGSVEVGTFLIEQNGGSYTYTFVPKAGTRGEASITLALTDSDGDTTSYTLPDPFTYEIREPGEGVNIPEVDERGLDGSNFPIENTAVMPEGWKPDPNGQGTNWVVDPATGVMTWDNPKGAPGVLTYTPPANPGDSGSLSFKLTGPYDHLGGDNGRNSQLFELPDLPIIHDAGSTGTIPVSFSIKDDVPTVTVQENASGVAGDPLEGAFNYDFGADGEASSDPIVLTFTDDKGSQSFTPPAFTIGDPFDVELGGKVVGSFTFEPDGSFTFVPAADEANRIITVKMEAKDNDGDTADASATITYGTGLPPILEFDPKDPFDEAYLPNGTKENDPAGTLTKYVTVPAGWTPDPAGWTDNQDGTWTKVVTPDANLDLKGVFIFDSSKTAGNLSFTLEDAIEHKLQGNDDLPLQVGLDFVHEYGTKGSTSAVLTVRDDMPDVTVDKNAAGLSSETLDGKFSYEFGADGEAGATPIVLTFDDHTGNPPMVVSNFSYGQGFNVEIGGKVLGEFTFNQDGTFTFTPAVDDNMRIAVTVQAEDNDGDTADATATITCSAELYPLTFNGAFDEGYLPGGTKEHDPNAELTKSVDITTGWSPDPNSWTDNGDGTWSKVITPDANSDLSGVFTYDPSKPDAELSFKLDKPVEHDAQGRDQSSYIVELDFVHVNGDSKTITAQVDVQDDMPVVTTMQNAAGQYGETLNGEFAYEFGADGPAAASSLALTFTDQSGAVFTPPANFTLGQPFDVVLGGDTVGAFTLNADGAFTFTPAKNENRVITVKLDAQDSDGDHADASATITCGTKLDPIIFDAANPFEEAFLPGGTKEGAVFDPANVTKYADVTAGWTPNPATWIDNGDGTWSKIVTPNANSDLDGVFTFDPTNPNGNLSFTLSGTVQHQAQGNDDLPFQVELDFVHVYGNSDNLTATLTVRDDMPAVTVEQNASGLYGNTLEGEFSYQFGADGEAALRPLILTFTDNRGSTAYTVNSFTFGQAFDVMLDGEKVGSFTLNQDGTFSYVAAKDENMQIFVKLQAEDEDGDISDASATINCGRNIDHVEFDPKDPFEEAFLPGGTHYDPLNPAAVVKYASIPEGWKPDPASWTDNQDGTWSKTVTSSANSDLEGVFTYDPTKTGSELAFELTSPVTHKTQGNDDLLFKVDLDFVHDLGDKKTVPAELTIQDDMPAVDGLSGGTGVSEQPISGEFDYQFGADGEAASNPLALTFTDDKGSAAFVKDDFTFGVAFDVELGGEVVGSFVFNQDGTFTYTSVKGDSRELTVSLEAKDSDLDVANDSVVLTYSENLEVLDFSSKGPFDEANLPEGTDPLGANQYPTKYISLADHEGWTPDTSAGSGWVYDAGAGVWTLDSADYKGVFTYDPNRTGEELAFTLKEVMDHDQQGRDVLTLDSVTIKFVHKYGADSDVTIKIAVQDDMPLATPNAVHNIQNASDVNGVLTVIFGADGKDPAFDQGGQFLSFKVEGTYSGPNGSEATNWPPMVNLAVDGTPFVHETQAGTWTLSYIAGAAAGQPNVAYTYTPKHALQGHTDTISIFVKDGDGDDAEAALRMHYEKTVPGELGLVVDEAALPFGSGAHFLHGDDSSSTLLPSSLILKDASSVLWQQPSEPLYIKADGDLAEGLEGEARYKEVTWIQKGGTYEGYAEGELVISVTAVFKAGVFTGQIDTTLYRPLYHSKTGGYDEQMDIKFGLVQQSPNGNADMDVIVSVKDDMPMRDYQDAGLIFDLNGGDVSYSHGAESVYILLDTACWMSKNEGQKAIDAVKALAQSYIDNGIDAVFSITGFNCKANTYFGHVTPQQVIDNLSWNLWRAEASIYSVGLDEAMRMMEVGRNTPQYKDWSQSLYFFSDGAGCKSTANLGKWTQYRDSRSDSLSVNVIDVNECPVTNLSKSNLLAVAGDPSNYYHHTNFEVVLDKVGNNAIAEASGNILGNVVGADGAFLTEIEFTDPDSGALRTHNFKNQGDFELIKDGVTIVVKADGSYTVQSGKLSDNMVEKFELTIMDHDGDAVKVPANLVITDATRAFDNVGVTSPYGVVDPLVSFGCAATNMVTGCYRYTCFTGQYLPGIPDYSSTLMGCKGYAALLCANKCVDGASVLRNIVGGEAEVQNLFGKLGLVDKTYGSNAIMSFDVVDSGGTIEFNWAFKAGAARCGLDSAFWFLMDSAGNIVDQGKMSQGASCRWDQGVATVNVPDFYGKYTLYIVQQEMGCGSRCPDSCLFLKDVVYKGDDNLRSIGNVITDASPDGQVDNYHGAAMLYAVDYTDVNGVEQTALFPASGKLSLQTEDGWLYIDNQGSYTFVANDGLKSDVIADFTYHLRDSRGDEVHADLHIRSEDHMIRGTDQGETLSARGDGDLVQAGGGDDLVYGSNGADVIYGGSGDDTIHGGSGNDTIHGGHGNDVIYGDAGDDVIYGGAGNDAIYGGAGNDLIFGGSGINFLNGGEGADTFAWETFSIGGKDIIADFSLQEGDKLSFSEILGDNPSYGDLHNLITGLDLSYKTSLDANGNTIYTDRVLSFEIDFNFKYDPDGDLNKLVEVRIENNDSYQAFDQFIANYDGLSSSAQEAALEQFFIQNFCK